MFLHTFCFVAVTKVPYEGVVQRKLTWDCPRKFISWCEDQCHVTRDSLTERFCAFLGESNCDVEKLRRYPHNWDDAIKGEYLMSLVASDHSNMWLLLRGSDLTWPFAENSPQRSCNLPELLQSILAWEAQRGRKYNILDFFSYIILLRNCYKHREDLPQNIKVTNITQVPLFHRCITALTSSFIGCIHRLQGFNCTYWGPDTGFLDKSIWETR